MPGLGFFELLPVGAGILAVGLPVILLMSSRLLAEQSGGFVKPVDAVRAYTTDLVIQAGSPLVGVTVEQARLRRLKGLFLVRIVRSERVISPVGPGEPLVVGDRLTFAGVLETIVELSGRRGFVPAEVDEMPAGWHLHEAVISRSSPLIGRSIKAANFRARYGAAVIAVHRHGGRINQKLGDIVLRHGDTVLVQTSQSFARTFRDSPDFYLISEVKDAERHDPRKALLALLVFLGAMASVVLGGVPIVTAAAAGAACSILFGCISINAARRSVDASVLVVMAAAIGLGQAAEVSGLTGYVIELLTGISGTVTPFFMLLIIYAVGMLFTEIVSNVAAAAILFPICLGVASVMGVDARPFVICHDLHSDIAGDAAGLSDEHDGVRSRRLLFWRLHAPRFAGSVSSCVLQRCVSLHILMISLSRSDGVQHWRIRASRLSPRSEPSVAFRKGCQWLRLAQRSFLGMANETFDLGVFNERE